MKKILPLLLVLLSFVLVVGCNKEEVKTTTEAKIPKKIDKFVVAGSGTCLPITKQLAEAYKNTNHIQIDIPKSIGSKGAVKAVKEGALELGLTARPLKDEEIKAGLKQIHFAQVAFVFGVNKDVPDSNINSKDIVDIYQGKKNTWQNGKMLVVIVREEGDSSMKILESKFPGLDKVFQAAAKESRWTEYYTDAEMAQAIIDTPWSFGLTDSGALAADKLNIKPLTFNGIAPTVENVKNGKYPLSKDLYFIYKDNLTERAKKFVDFVKSEKGFQLILNNGGLPIKE